MSEPDGGGVFNAENAEGHRGAGEGEEDFDAGGAAHFYHAENCQFVRQQMRNRTADEIMSRGVQLSDLFDALPPLAAQRQFQHELAKMHALSLALLEKRPVAA